MKKRIIAALCLLAVCIGFAACSCGNEIHTIETKANGCYDKNTGVNYLFAPSAYEPTAYEKETFGIDDFDGEYRRVSFTNGNIVDASDWLYAKDDGILAYNEKKALPSFDQLEVNMVNFCVEDTTSIILSTIDKDDEVADLIDLFKNGLVCERQTGDASDVYYVKFVSSVYPIAYSVMYIEFESDRYEYEETTKIDGYEFREGVSYTVEETDGIYTISYNYGKYFIYDRSTGICRTAEYIHENYME